MKARHKIVVLFVSGLLLHARRASTDSLLPGTTAQSPLTLTDPELSSGVAPLPKLVLEPPAEVQLPDVIAEHDQWRGSQCGVTEPRFATFHHADKWQMFWKQGIAPYSKKFAEAPPIDFSKEMILGVFMGEKPIPNYQVKIISVRLANRLSESTLIVRYREIERMVGVFAPPFPVQPFHLKRWPRFDGPIVFEKIR